MDPDLSAVIIGAELTRLGANCFGAEVQGHFLRVVDVAACVARTWYELGAVDLDAKLGVVDLGVPTSPVGPWKANRSVNRTRRRARSHGLTEPRGAAAPCIFATRGPSACRCH